MFYEAAKVLSNAVSEEELANGTVYPSFLRIKDVSSKIAVAITKVAVNEGLAQKYFLDNVEENIKNLMYQPDYPEYI